LGTILSLIFGWGVASAGWNGQMYAEDLLAFIPVLALGFFFPRTIGTSMVGVQVGAVLALLFSLIRIDLVGMGLSVVIFVCAMLVQILLTIFRPNASASVDAYGPNLGRNLFK
jgi:hypothetical protein